jgi:hypothetical protein
MNPIKQSLGELTYAETQRLLVPALSGLNDSRQHWVNGSLGLITNCSKEFVKNFDLSCARLLNIAPASVIRKFHP